MSVDVGVALQYVDRSFTWAGGIDHLKGTRELSDVGKIHCCSEIVFHLKASINVSFLLLVCCFCGLYIYFAECSLYKLQVSFLLKVCYSSLTMMRRCACFLLFFFV